MQTEFLKLLDARRGHFKLESGHHGDLWLELDKLFLHPKKLDPFVMELAQRLAQHHITAVCGPLTGGAFIAQRIAAELDIEFYYTQRFVTPQVQGLYPVEYRLPDALKKHIAGQSCAIVDDVINAGSAVRGTFETLQSAGANVKAIGAPLVLGSTAPDYFATHHIPMETIAQQTSGLWSPVDCPLCAMHTPLEDVTANVG